MQPSEGCVTTILSRNIYAYSGDHLLTNFWQLANTIHQLQCQVVQRQWHLFLQHGVLSAGFLVAPNEGKRDRIKLSMIFAARNMPDSLVRYYCRYQALVLCEQRYQQVRYRVDSFEIYHFCCTAGLYCLYGNYPGCQQTKPTPVGAEAPTDFCEKHLQQALEEGDAQFVTSILPYNIVYTSQ